MDSKSGWQTVLAVCDLQRSLFRDVLYQETSIKMLLRQAGQDGKDKQLQGRWSSNPSQFSALGSF
jgi:hypothetical protein